jgi:hypothetical protein
MNRITTAAYIASDPKKITLQEQRTAQCPSPSLYQELVSSP